MNKLFTGALDIDVLREILATNHSGKWKTKSDGQRLNIKMWISDTPDKFGNTVTILPNSRSKEDESKEGKIYLANLKAVDGKSDSWKQQPAQSGGEDLPF